MKIKNLLLVALLIITATGINAQDKEWGGFLGISDYNGDLAQSPIPIRGMRPAIGGFYRYNFNPRWAIKAGLNYGYIASYDRYSGKGTNRENRNLSFHSPLIELSVVGELNLKKYISGSRKFRTAPYLFGGIAGFYYEPQTWLRGNRVKLRTLNTDAAKPEGGYSPIAIAIPMGIGVKHSIGKRKLWNIGFEFGYRKTFTDFLDDVSGNMPADYPNVPPMTQEEADLAYRGNPKSADGKGWPPRWPRGNPDLKDSYYFFGVSISKTFRKFECRNF